ncbi:MAG: helix-turn-helix domain-containing protein [Planctomycetes bacterium]|nr:helix-turn-helix domain-containing protein [Planctomycetota bacterium]
MLGVSPATVRRLRVTGRIPPAIRIGRSVRWCASELRRWIDAGCPAGARLAELRTVPDVHG